MGSWIYLVYLGSLMIISVECHEDILPFENRLDDLEDEIVDVRDYAFRIEKRVMNKVDVAKTSLKSELEQHIKQILKDAMADILQGESIEEMLRSQVITEVRQLRRGNHHMKRQLHNVMKSLKDVQEDRDMYREAFLKGERNEDEMKICSKYLEENVMLETKLQKCKIKNDLLRENKPQNITYGILEINTSRTPVPDQELATSSSSSEPSSTTTTITTTPKCVVKRKSWILISAYRSSSQHQFHKLNIHSNTLQNYPYLNLKYVSALTYASKLNILFIGFAHTDKVISSNLQGSDVKTMREGVQCLGMAIDEGRQLVFMSLWIPPFSISRMTTDGKYYTPIVDLSSYGRWPRSIVVDAKEKRIYACNEVKLYMLTYDGRILETLATGTEMNAVELDITGRFLYYNNEKKLMKMSLSTNISSEVTTLSSLPWNFQYYNNTLYYSSYSSSSTNTGYIRAVTLRNNVIKYTLKSINMKSIRGLCICLIP